MMKKLKEGTKKLFEKGKLEVKKKVHDYYLKGYLPEEIAKPIAGEMIVKSGEFNKEL